VTEYNQQHFTRQYFLSALMATCLGAVVYVAVFTGLAHAGERIVLHALFSNKAIMMIDGKRRVLSVGEESPEGVKLTATNTETESADIIIAGESRRLHLGSIALSAPKREKSEMQTTLWADPSGHFFTTGTINGVAVTFLVDTGATSIAMNSNTARRVGIDYKRGRKGYASTASGIAPMYEVDIKRVKVGDIEMKYLKGGVIEGAHPTEVLLGMSFLKKVEMRREGNKMNLLYKK